MLNIGTNSRIPHSVGSARSGSIDLELVIWQTIVSIHQAALVSALASIPRVKVTYVAGEIIDEDRRALGWLAPSLGAASLVIVDSASAVEKLVAQFPDQAIHICQGIRGNGLVGIAEKYLRKRRARIVIQIETVDDYNLAGVPKRIVYALRLRQAVAWADSILAIGERTPIWFADRGFPKSRIFPFAYFLGLPTEADTTLSEVRDDRPFQIAFVGSFIPLKRLDLLIRALAELGGESNYQLTVVGTGPLEDEWKRRAVERLGARVVWRGLLPAIEIPRFLASVDCLVLPSRHEGWGAVVSESLLVGTPAICSSRCGSAEAVRCSRAGGVFRSGDRDALAECLLCAMKRGVGRTQERAHLADWARRSLGGPAGASYLIEILRHCFEGGKRPVPPWLTPRL